MYLVIWEYQVKADRVAEFERIYSAGGAWSELFRRSTGFLETQLFRDVGQPYRYVTIDRWVSSKDFAAFLSEWKAEYGRLDMHCETLTEREALLCKWEFTSRETR